MSNATDLIATDRPGPVVIDDGKWVGFTGRQVIADGPCAVPAFWLALFEPDHRVTIGCTGDDGDVLVPSLVADRAEAIRRLDSRSPLLRATFPEFGPTLESFARLVGRSKRRFIKIRLQELWDLGPDELESHLKAAFRWFRAGVEEDFHALLELASIANYDPQARTFGDEGASVPRAFHLRGYSIADRAWDNTDDT